MQRESHYPALAAGMRVTPDADAGGSFLIVSPAGRRWLVSGDCGRFLTLLDGTRSFAQLTAELQREKWNELRDCNAEDVVALLHQRTSCLEGSEPDSPQRRLRGTATSLSLDLFESVHVRPLSRKLRWLTTRPIVLSATFGSVAAVTVAAWRLWHGSVLRSSHVSLLLLLVALLLTGPIHELGHIVASEYFSAKPGKIGIGFYMGVPVMYVDLSCIWHLPRLQRIAVNLAGIYFQVLAAGLLCTSGVLLHVDEVTILGLGYFASGLVNLNPLLRMDGYWCLSDWMQAPNLRKDSRRAVWAMLRHGFGDGKSFVVSNAVLMYGLVHLLFIAMFVIVGLRSLNSTYILIRDHHEIVLQSLRDGRVVLFLRIVARLMFAVGVIALAGRMIILRAVGLLRRVSVRRFAQALMLLCLMTGLPRLNAQEQNPPYSIQVNARLASAQVSVRSKRTGIPIEKLSPSDFRVFDNAREVPLVHFGLLRDDAKPIALLILLEAYPREIETMNALADHMEEILRRSLRPGDFVAVATAAPGFEVVQEFTTEREMIVAAVRRVAEAAAVRALRAHLSRKEKVEEGSENERAVRAAITSACELAAGRIGFRPELVFVTDDLTWSPRAEVDQNIKTLLKGKSSVNVLIHAEGSTAFGKFLLNAAPTSKYDLPNVIRTMAQNTGGISLDVKRDQIAKGFEDLIVGIESEYLMEWKPALGAEPYHRVRVALIDNTGAELRAQAGYYLPAQPGAEGTK